MIQSDSKFDEIAKSLDPALQISLKDSEHWGETLLQKLIRERRVTPKAER